MNEYCHRPLVRILFRDGTPILIRNKTTGAELKGTAAGDHKDNSRDIRIRIQGTTGGPNLFNRNDWILEGDYPDAKPGLYQGVETRSLYVVEKDGNVVRLEARLRGHASQSSYTLKGFSKRLAAGDYVLLTDDL